MFVKDEGVSDTTKGLDNECICFEWRLLLITNFLASLCPWVCAGSAYLVPSTRPKYADATAVVLAEEVLGLVPHASSGEDAECGEHPSKWYAKPPVALPYLSSINRIDNVQSVPSETKLGGDEVRLHDGQPKDTGYAL